MATTSSAMPPSASPAPTTDKDNSLSLKVMRLTRPMFYGQQPLGCERTDLAASAVLYDGGASQSLFSLSDCLLLPQSFGNIYLGETFSSYISINNTSPYNVTHLGIKAELQSPTEKITLLEMPASNLPVFSPGDNQDFVISHKIRNEGTHILVCSATYVRNDGEKKYFRKFFKFQVDQPLSLTCRKEAVGGGHCVEVQVKNASKAPLFVDSTSFLPTPAFEAKSLNAGADDGHAGVSGIVTTSRVSSELQLPKLTLLKPGHVRQYVFLLSAVTDVGGLGDGSGEELGRIEILWKSYTGGTGKIVTPPVHGVDLSATSVQEAAKGKRVAHPSTPPSFSLMVTGMDSSGIVVQRPLDVTCRLTNVSKKTLTPRLYSMIERQSGLVVNGMSGAVLKTLAPGDHVDVLLNVIPLQPGIQRITGLRVVDKKSEKHFDFDDIAEVLVQQDAGPNCR